MIDWLKQKFRRPSRIQQEAVEREKIVRLEQAEFELSVLTERKDRAVQYLSDRQSRNHWREGIEMMIQGRA